MSAAAAAAKKDSKTVEIVSDDDDGNTIADVEAALPIVAEAMARGADDGDVKAVMDRLSPDFRRADGSKKLTKANIANIKRYLFWEKAMCNYCTRYVCVRNENDCCDGCTNLVAQAKSHDLAVRLLAKLKKWKALEDARGMAKQIAELQRYTYAKLEARRDEKRRQRLQNTINDTGKQVPPLPHEPRDEDTSGNYDSEDAASDDPSSESDDATETESEFEPSSDDSDAAPRRRRPEPTPSRVAQTPPRTRKRHVCPPAPPRAAGRLARPVFQNPRRLFEGFIFATDVKGASDVDDADEEKRREHLKTLRKVLNGTAAAAPPSVAATAALSPAMLASPPAQSSVRSWDIWGAPPQEDAPAHLIAPDPAAFTEARPAKRKASWATRAATRTGTRSDKRRKASPPTPHSSPSK